MLPLASIVVAEEWSPPPPTADEFDWVQLSSGEWLKGEMKGYIDDEIHFDSDKLGLQKLEREDVKFLRTAKSVQVGYVADPTTDQDLKLLGRNELEVSEGRVELKDGKISSRDTGKEIAPFDEVLALAPGNKSDWDNWSGKVSLGVNLREGNTEQLEYNASAEVTRITPNSRLNLNYLGNYSESEGTEFSNNHRADFNYDLYRTPRFFLRPIFGEYYRDPFQNIAHRISVGTGLGYEVIDTPKTSWELSGGPAYQYVEYDSVEGGASSGESAVAAAFESVYEREINDRVDFVSRYLLFLSSAEFGAVSHHFENSFEVELTDQFDLELSLIWDRVNDPARDSNGDIPKEDDLRLMFMLGYEL